MLSSYMGTATNLLEVAKQKDTNELYVVIQNWLLVQHECLIHVSCLVTSNKYMSALGVLCCFALFVCLTLLASFFLPSHLSLKHVHVGGISLWGRWSCLWWVEGRKRG